MSTILGFYWAAIQQLVAKKPSESSPILSEKMTTHTTNNQPHTKGYSKRDLPNDINHTGVSKKTLKEKIPLPLTQSSPSPPSSFSILSLSSRRGNSQKHSVSNFAKNTYRSTLSARNDDETFDTEYDPSTTTYSTPPPTSSGKVRAIRDAAKAAARVMSGRRNTTVFARPTVISRRSSNAVEPISTHTSSNDSSRKRVDVPHRTTTTATTPFTTHHGSLKTLSEHHPIVSRATSSTVSLLNETKPEGSPLVSSKDDDPTLIRSLERTSRAQSTTAVNSVTSVVTAMFAGSHRRRPLSSVDSSDSTTTTTTTTTTHRSYPTRLPTSFSPKLSLKIGHKNASAPSLQQSTPATDTQHVVDTTDAANTTEQPVKAFPTTATTDFFIQTLSEDSKMVTVESPKQVCNPINSAEMTPPILSPSSNRKTLSPLSNEVLPTLSSLSNLIPTENTSPIARRNTTIAVKGRPKTNGHAAALSGRSSSQRWSQMPNILSRSQPTPPVLIPLSCVSPPASVQTRRSIPVIEEPSNLSDTTHLSVNSTLPPNFAGISTPDLSFSSSSFNSSLSSVPIAANTTHLSPDSSLGPVGLDILPSAQQPKKRPESSSSLSFSTPARVPSPAPSVLDDLRQLSQSYAPAPVTTSTPIAPNTLNTSNTPNTIRLINSIRKLQCTDFIVNPTSPSLPHTGEAATSRESINMNVDCLDNDVSKTELLAKEEKEKKEEEEEEEGNFLADVSWAELDAGMVQMIDLEAVELHDGLDDSNPPMPSPIHEEAETTFEPLYRHKIC